MATQIRPTAPPGTPEFKPYVPPTQSPAELTIRAVVLGAILGIVFAASSVYLALKIGLTVSASIIGGAVRWLVERRRLRSGSSSITEVESGPGVLYASGLIAGGAIAGVTIAGVAAAMVVRAEAAQVPAAEYLAHAVGLQRMLGGFASSHLVSLAMFALLGALLYRVARR